MRACRTVLLPAILATALSTPHATGAAADKPLLGFSPEASAVQRDLEDRFDGKLKAENLRAWMKRLSARPHEVGSPYGKDIAEFTASQFRAWGYDTRIEEFQVLFPTPKTRLLEMLEPTRLRAVLAEPALKEDATSGQAAEQLPVYNAYSIDGDVTAPLVYVNYGVPKDYEELERRGIDVKGRIVIARYGGSWRGIKPKVAAEHGAVGCLIYSDPRDDGYFEGDVQAAHDDFKRELEAAGFTILFDEVEENDSEVSWEGEGRSGQVAIRNECGESDKMYVKVTNRPAS